MDKITTHVNVIKKTRKRKLESNPNVYVLETYHEVEVVDSSLPSREKSFREDTPQRFYNVSGHVVDQALKGNYDRDRKQLSLEDLGLDLKTEGLQLDYGIRLPAGADALKNTIERMLYETKSKGGLGNYKATTALLCGSQRPAPQLLLGLNELARSHTGKPTPSGSDLNEVKRNLKILKEKQHVFILKGSPNNEGKRPLVADYQSIIVNLTEVYPEGLSKGEEQKLSTGEDLSSSSLKKAKLLITCSPLLALDIENKYVPKPSDINSRLMEASGSSKPSSAIRRFSDYCFRQMTDKTTKVTGRHEIGEEKLIYQLGLDKYQKEGRKGKVRQGIESAFAACKHSRLPLLREVSKVLDKQGKPKYVLTFNSNFPEPANLLEGSHSEGGVALA